MRIIKKEPDIHIHSYQLTDQDYKNILSRTFYKLWWLFGLFIISLLTGGYLLINEIAEKTVNKILNQATIQSQFFEYKEKLLTQATHDINDAKNYYIKELKKYQYLPYSISNNSMKLFDTAGKALIIEFGKGKTANKIEFKEKFNQIPYVQVTSSDSKNFEPYNYRRVTFIRIMNIKELTKDYFIAYYGLPAMAPNVNLQIEINWIAIGY
jgi:hypothetical protein